MARRQQAQICSSAGLSWQWTLLRRGDMAVVGKALYKLQSSMKFHWMAWLICTLCHEDLAAKALRLLQPPGECCQAQGT